MQCALCDREFIRGAALATHLRFSHKNWTKKDYYDVHIGTMSNVCRCGAQKKFRNIQEGYRLYCSHKCKGVYVDYGRCNLGRKQSESHILKRLANTNQINKEAKRKKTMMALYGVSSPSELPTHKEKVKATSLERYGTEHPHQNRNVKSGVTWKKIVVEGREFHVQGYEDLFLKSLSSFDLRVDDVVHGKANCPQFKWVDESGKTHIYFPDFFIPTRNLIIEVKSAWTLKQSQVANDKKFSAVKDSGYNFMCVVYKSRDDQQPEVMT